MNESSQTAPAGAAERSSLVTALASWLSASGHPEDAPLLRPYLPPALADQLGPALAVPEEAPASPVPARTPFPVMSPSEVEEFYAAVQLLRTERARWELAQGTAALDLPRDGT